MIVEQMLTFVTESQRNAPLDDLKD